MAHPAAFVLGSLLLTAPNPMEAARPEPPRLVFTVERTKSTLFATEGSGWFLKATSLKADLGGALRAELAVTVPQRSLAESVALRSGAVDAAGAVGGLYRQLTSVVLNVTLGL